jgi:chaperonin GroES
LTTAKRLIGENIMKIRPLHDRVIVRREEEEQTTAGGILLPGSAQEKPNQGQVVAVGSGRILDNGDVRPVDVKVGDTVVFGQYAGNDKIDVDGEELIILSENDIKAVVEG